MTNKVVLLNHKALRAKATPVDETTLKYVNETLVPNMVEVMKAEKGLGLAANQVADPLNVFIMDNNGELGIYLNAEILEGSDDVVHEEGCLSIPGATGKIVRFNKLKLRFQDETFTTREVELEGVQAIAAQHEVDHLNGILYIDYLGDVSTHLIINKHKKFLKLRSRLEKK